MERIQDAVGNSSAFAASLSELLRFLERRRRDLGMTYAQLARLSGVPQSTLVRILHEKGFLEPTNSERPFRYRPVRSYEQVSGRLLSDLVQRVFRGSRAQLLVRLVGERKLTAQERAVLATILKEQNP